MADITDATFQAEVVERSKQTPVVVDLWAPWCGPCRTLGPTIEKVIGEMDGKVLLAKVNVDENPAVASAFRVQSIPAVFALKGGQVVDSFVGALPEHSVREFVQRLAPVVTVDDVLAENGDEESLRESLANEPDNQTVAMALASILLEKGENAEVLALMAKFPETSDTGRLSARARIAMSELDVSSPEKVEEQLTGLLDSVKADEDSRKRFVDLLEVFDVEDPRRSQYRRMLTARLF